MKKKIAILLAALLACMFFAACGNPSMDSIKTKFKDKGYTISTASKSDLNKVAGAVEGFHARLGLSWEHELYGEDSPAVDIKVWVYKFSSKNLAEEYANKTYENQAFSAQGKYVCRVQHHIPDEYEYLPDSPEVKALLKLFNDCF